MTTVKELIEMLKSEDPDNPVIFQFFTPSTNPDVDWKNPGMEDVDAVFPDGASEVFYECVEANS